MFKKKNIYVIFVSVLVVVLVVVSSFLGLIVYFQWRQLNFTISYYEALEKFDTISDVKNIAVDSLKIGLGFEGLPLVEGRIKNKGKRAVVFIELKVNLLDSSNQPVYSYILYPLEPFRPPRLFRRVNFTHLVFLKENSIRPDSAAMFKGTIWHCPKKYVKMLKKSSFSNNPGEWCGKIGAEVIRIRLKSG